MATKQGYLKEKGSQDKLAPKTLDSLVKDSARNRALSASLQELAERQCLGYPPFATTQNYAVGDKVFHDRKLWKFTSSHSAGAWNASHVTAWSVEDEVSELKLAVTALDERKANIDGFYEGMGVGVAKRLEGNTDVAGSFLERPTGGDAELANGLAQLNEVQGGSVKFNQLISIVHFTGTYEQYGIAGAQRSKFSVISGHKYYISVIDKTLPVSQIRFRDITENYAPDVNNDGEKTIFISEITSSNTTFVQFGGSAATYAGNSFDAYINVIDLTDIFGAGNEPSTVAEFEAWLAENVGLKEYYDYTDGEVVNNNMTGIESTGFNLFNPTTGKARIIGAYSEVYGNYYGIVGTHGTLTFEDDFGNVSTITPDADGKFELDVSGYLSVADAGNDVAVFLWWDGKKTEYEDYDVEIAHLDVRHIYGKKNGTGELVQVWPTGMPRINDIVDKLCIENGAVVAKRAIQEVDMGGLTWNKTGTDTEGKYRFHTSSLTDIKISANADTAGNLLCVKYTAVSANETYHLTQGICVLNNSVRIYDPTYNDSTATEFKAVMNGVLLYYELATPETYTDLVYMGSEYFADGTPVVLPVNYKVDNWGVETILPKNTSTILTAKPTIKVRYAIDAVEQLNTHSDKIEDLYDGLDELDGAKANTVGVYDNMVVGAAKAIAGNQRLDKVFTSMVVEGADGVAKINEVRGKSLVWNQLVQNGNFADGTTSWSEIGSAVCTVNNGIATISAINKFDAIKQLHIPLAPTHKILAKCVVKSISGTWKFALYNNNGQFDVNTTNVDVTSAGIVNILAVTSSDASGIGVCLYKNTETQMSIEVTDIVIFDLTQMFGAGNEPATVEEFEAMFPDAYYEYNDGEIINNATEELDVTGFNQWDEEYDEGYSINNNTGAKYSAPGVSCSKNPIKVVGGNTYYCKCATNQGMYGWLYDSSGTYIGVGGFNIKNSTFVTPSNAGYLNIAFETAKYNHDICINISDPSRNGTYEPYKHGVVPLNLSTITGKQVGIEDAESEVIFPDGMRQAGSVADTLLVDDDGYARRAIIKIGSVDLGTLNWKYRENGDSTLQQPYFYDLSNINELALTTNRLCSKYASASTWYRTGTNDKEFSYYGGGDKKIVVCDSAYSDAATFKTAMSGVELIYELAEYKEYILDEPILMTFKAYHGGTIVQSPQAPDSAPMSMNVTFALDAVGTLNNLPKNYISADSMDAFLAQLGTAMNGTWTKSWDAANNRYTFSFQSSQTE